MHMKKITLILTLVVGFMGLMAMQAQNAAEFNFDSETHDFGKIPQGTPVSHNFKFTNTGSEPLIISDVKSSCGCTVPTYPKTPIKPGEEGTIQVTYNAADPNPFTKTVTIRSNTKTPVKVLYIKGEVVN